jgi:uncharacterized repeat protein (TIGR01451 family)
MRDRQNDTLRGDPCAALSVEASNMKIRAHSDHRGGQGNRKWTRVGVLIAAWICLLHLSGPLSPLLGIPTVAAELLENVTVNYAHNWVAGHTDPSAEVTVTVNDEHGVPKGATTVTAGLDGNFHIDCPAYDPNPCPDINPGDTVIVDATGLQHVIEPVGSIDAIPDEHANTISGTLHADWLTGPVPILCEVWVDMGPPPIDTTAEPDGGTFVCDFTGTWDLKWDEMVAVSYFEPDGDRVMNFVVWPWMRVNYAHDWVGGNYPAGHPVTVQLTDDLGVLKATAELDTNWGAGWGVDGFETAPEHWSPAPPDIVPFDWVYTGISGDEVITYTVEVGDIAAVVDVDADTVGGTVDANWLTGPIQVECHPWGAGFPLPPKIAWVEPDGEDTFTCDWSGEWDMLPGQDVAVMYIEPDTHHMVINVVHEPAPHLSIGKGAHGAPAEGGNLVFTINYHNGGEAVAESVVITDTMEVIVGETPVPGGMSYLSDSSGLPHTGTGSGPIVWDVGTLDPHQEGAFEVYVAVTSSAGEVIRNSAEIGTSSFDSGPPEEKHVMWEGPTLENDTHLDVAKNSWIPDPTPGEPVVFNIPVCNRGQTGSTELTLTDTMAGGLTLDSWWADHPGWAEVTSGPASLTLSTPSIPGHECREVRVQATVDMGVTPGQPLSNLVVISADNDMETGDNEALWEAIADAPHFNLWILKRLNRGIIAPGGELTYNIPYGNNGNQSAAPVLIVDTLPLGTSFVSSWHSGDLGHYDIVPIAIEPEYLVWQLAEVPGGARGNIEVHLAIDPAATPGSELTNRVEICGPPDASEPCSPIPGEDTYDDNTDEWTEVLFPAGPNLRIIKRSVWAGPETLRYILRFQNIGNQMIPDIAVIDTLPDVTNWDGWWDLGFPHDRLAGDIIHEDGVLTWNFHELHPGEDGRIRFTAVLDGSQEPLQWIENSAEITLPDGDTNPDDNIDITADLWGNQCAGDDVILFEETYTEAFWCQAPGSITASSVTVTGTGQATLRSPLVVFENHLAIESGGTLDVGAP